MRDLLFVSWSLDANHRGNVYADNGSEDWTLIGHFDEHVLAADAVAAHNAVLSAREAH